MMDQHKTKLLATSLIGSAARSILPADLPRLPGSTYKLLQLPKIPCPVWFIFGRWGEKGNLSIPSS